MASDECGGRKRLPKVQFFWVYSYRVTVIINCTLLLGTVCCSILIQDVSNLTFTVTALELAFAHVQSQL